MFWVMLVAVLAGIVFFCVFQTQNETVRQEKKNASINELKETKQKLLLKLKEELLNSLKNSDKKNKSYPIKFLGQGNSVLGFKRIVGAITNDICCVVSEDGSVIDYYFAPYRLTNPFAVIKEKEKQRNTVMMDVQEAARIGNGIGGIGAAASAAANASKINSQGGLRVEHNVTAHHLFFITEADKEIDNPGNNSSSVAHINPVLTTKAMVEIRFLWINGEQVRVPSTKKEVAELCDRLNKKMHSLGTEV